MQNRRNRFLCIGKPTFYHFISYGYGALLTLTPRIGKSFYFNKLKQCKIWFDLFLYKIYFFAPDDLNVTKTTF